MDDERIRKVVGLKYVREEGLPRVMVKGSGELAEKMLATQKEPGAPPLVEDEALLNALYKLPVDAEIGPELFELVAILLVHVYAMEQHKEIMTND